MVDGELRYTYAQAIERARRLAAALAGLGAQPGDRIAVLDRNSHRYLEAYFACAWGGFTIVPLNTRLAKAEQDRILLDCQPKALLSDPDDHESLVSRGHAGPPAPADPQALSAIYYTSGTTGEPKGVCLAQRAVVAGIADALYGLDFKPDDVWLHAAPLFHLADAFAIWALTLAGARQVLMHFNAEGFLEMVERERVTKTSLPPTLISMVANLPEARSADLASLRRISYGGSPMPEDLYRRAAEVFGCELLQAYGITETTGFVCCAMPGDPPGSVGRPVPGVRLKLVDGEFVVSGPKLMCGYWRKPQATAEALRDGWYYTGDLGHVDGDGRYFIRDRKKDMIISGGENVYPVEVENALAAHPAVLEAAVFGVPDAKWGEAVKAVVVLRPGAQASEAELIAWCRARVGGYKIPKSIEVSSEPLPKSGPGKIARHLLRKLT